MTQSQLNELSQIVKEFSKNDFVVAAIPGRIRNSGKYEDVIKTGVGHIPSQKFRNFIYRGPHSEYRNALRTAVDEIINEIHAEIVEEKNKKPDNSL